MNASGQLDISNQNNNNDNNNDVDDDDEEDDDDDVRCCLTVLNLNLHFNDFSEKKNQNNTQM